ncbi:MAG: hypothetical protein V1802_01660 [Candidatus Aenigmatarchaeota archaeon]
MMSFAKRFLIIVSVVIALTDLIVFYAVERSHATVTLPFVIAVIIITIIPIAVNLWFHLPRYKMKW